jgi:2-C-methyl-D-erythritol 4-phosphate cytidylyltransferase
METLKLSAVITAGGMGLRLPGNVKKQFRELAGKPILFRSLEPFATHPKIREIIITLPSDDMESYPPLIDAFLNSLDTTCTVQYRAGGLQRQSSVFNGLEACAQDTDIVLIHDGVRPFVTHELINELVALTQKYGAAIPTAPLKDTIKTTNGDIIDHTLRRDILVRAFTPQVFSYSLLMKCYKRAMTDKYYSTDDSALLEHYGYQVHYINDTSYNLKITDELDFLVAEQILKYQVNNVEDIQ